MRAARAPPSTSSLLHLVCRHQPTTAARTHLSSAIRSQCVWRTLGGSNGLHQPPICLPNCPSTVRGFASSSLRCSNLPTPQSQTDRYLSFLAPREIFSRRGTTGNSLMRWKRGLFGRKAKEEPSEKTMSETYLDSGSDNSILGRHLLHKPNDMVLRCTEFDQDGKNSYSFTGKPLHLHWSP